MFRASGFWCNKLLFSGSKREKGDFGFIKMWLNLNWSRLFEVDYMWWARSNSKFTSRALNQEFFATNQIKNQLKAFYLPKSSKIDRITDLIGSQNQSSSSIIKTLLPSLPLTEKIVHVEWPYKMSLWFATNYTQFA